MSTMRVRAMAMLGVILLMLAAWLPAAVALQTSLICFATHLRSEYAEWARVLRATFKVMLSGKKISRGGADDY